MAAHVEIERKFLVRTDRWTPGGDSERLVQGYLRTDPDCTVRVRLGAGRGWITIKGRRDGIARREYEYEIPAAEAETLLTSLCGGLVEKTRHRMEFAGRIWEVDLFAGDNEGLVVAEVELDAADEEVALPDWVGEEVSEDRRYTNSYLSRHPFRTWESGAG